MICLDSDCIIDFLKGKKEAVNIIAKYKEQVTTTQINLFEVFYGIYNKNVQNEIRLAEQFFDSLKILDIGGWGKQSAQILAKLRSQGKEINQNDGLTAGIMLMNNCSKIITKNHTHLSRIKGINVIKY